jgi:hypothetical protein
MRTPDPIAAGLAVIGTAAAGLALASLPSRRPQPEPMRRPTPARSLEHTPWDADVAVRAGRRLNRASGTIAASVLLDSAAEHYRGAFHNKAMVAPLVSSALALLAGAHGAGDRRAAPHPARDTAYATAGLIGLLGTGFHLYNVGKKPGGFSFQNLFYSAPIGAPTALLLSGMLGFLAERVRDNEPGSRPTIAGLPAGAVVAAGTAAGLMGTVGEAGLLHLRGAYHDPFMFLPVTVPPLAAVLVGAAGLSDAHKPHGLARWWLRLTALLGFAGAGFHAFGVARNMGGWRNWSQNLLNGPPVPAPPSFTGLALAGLAALGLLEDQRP